MVLRGMCMLAAIASVLSVAAGCAPGPPPPTPLPPVDLDAPVPFVAQRQALVVATTPPPGFESPAIASQDSCVLSLSRAPRADCRQLFPLRVSATSNVNDAQLATDGSVCTGWESGVLAPASITFDFGAATRVDILALVPDMQRDGSVEHELSVSDDGQTFQPSQTIQAPMQSRVAVELTLPRPVTARFFRLTTKRSGSVVAWREIGLFACGDQSR